MDSYYDELVLAFNQYLDKVSDSLSDVENMLGWCLVLQFVTIVMLLWFIKENNDKNNKF